MQKKRKVFSYVVLENLSRMPKNWPAKTIFSERLNEWTSKLLDFLCLTQIDKVIHQLNWFIECLYFGLHLFLYLLVLTTSAPTPSFPCSPPPTLQLVNLLCHLLLRLGLLLVSLAFMFFALFIPSVSLSLLSFSSLFSFHWKAPDM